MEESLAEQIRTIEKIPSYVTIDKEKAIIELIEKRRKDNSLVDKAIRRENQYPENTKALQNTYQASYPSLFHKPTEPDAAN